MDSIFTRIKPELDRVFPGWREDDFVKCDSCKKVMRYNKILGSRGDKRHGKCKCGGDQMHCLNLDIEWEFIAEGGLNPAFLIMRTKEYDIKENDIRVGTRDANGDLLW